MGVRSVFLTLLSAAILALALPNELFPYGNPLLGLFCLTPFFYVVCGGAARAARPPGLRQVAWLGAIFGFVSTLLANYWLLFFQQFAAWTLGGVVLGYAGYNALLAAFLAGLSRISGRYRCLALAAGWAVYEYLKSIGFLGYPWGLIAYPVHSVLPLVQFVDITGVWGLSFLMALINAAAAEYFLSREPRAALLVCCTRSPASRLPAGTAAPLRESSLFTLALVALALAYGTFRLQAPIPHEKEMKLLLVQQNTDPWDTGGVLENIRTNQELTRQSLLELRRKPDLVVWSESSVRYPVISNEPFFERNPREDPLLPFIRDAGTWFLIGAPVLLDREKGTAMNSVLLFTPEGTVADYYGKQHPVPFAESVPFWEVGPVRRFFQEVIGLDSVWQMGNRFTLLEIQLQSGKMARIAAPICFEDAFSDLCRRFVLEGADLWINLTNDYWSKTVSAETQHFVVARLRAIENRRVLIRSTNGGVTAVVGPKGEMLGRLPLFQPGTLSTTVPIYLEPAFTPYTRYGDYFPQALALILLAVLAGGAASAYHGAGRPARQACRGDLLPLRVRW
jgi:apolipoprotein N-acyltransferase